MVVCNPTYLRWQRHDAASEIVQLRAEAAKHRREAEHCSLRDNLPAIDWHVQLAKQCEFAAGQLEGRQ